MTAQRGIILYGPPASGKTTITKELTRLDPQFRLYERLKVGHGQSIGYRMTTHKHLQALRSANALIWENMRYGSTYAVDATSLQNAVDTHIPVLHLGQLGAIRAIQNTAEGGFCLVSLECSKDEAKRRMLSRGDRDLDDRIAAWDATAPFDGATLTLNTERLSPAQSARTVSQLFFGKHHRETATESQ